MADPIREEFHVQHALQLSKAPSSGLAVTDERGHHGSAELATVVHRLIDAVTAGAGSRPAIGIWGSHGSDLVCAVVAALACGRRLAFLDPASQPRNLSEIVKALGIDVLLDASPDRGPTLDGVVTIKVGTLTHETGRDARGPRQSLARGLPDRMIANDYAILTSGTTGEPKIILQTLPHLQQHIANYTRYTEISQGDKVLQLASAGWDAGLMDLFSCIFTGATLCSFDPRRHDLQELSRFIDDTDPDVIHITVPLFRLLHGTRDALYRTPKRVVLGGEVIHRTDLQMFDRTFPAGSTIFNAYGPTECTTALYAKRLRGTPIADPLWALPHVVDGVTVDLEGEGAESAASGVTGELIIRSTLMACHLDPVSGATATLYTPRPTGREGYATGDRAHYDDRGGIVITGRTDSVIKVNGQKVSLVDIETELRAAPGVGDTCVIARMRDAGYEIVAAVVPVHRDIDSRALRRYLASRLPGHKMPKRIIMIDALPLNRNNKIDRKALEALAARDAERHEASDAGPTSLLARAIGSALPDMPVDGGLSFHENGGDSLQAIAVLADLKRSGLDIGLSDLLSDLSLDALESRVKGADAIAPPLGPIDPTLALPNRAFLESLSIPDLDRWHQAVVFDYRGPLDTPALALLVATILRRHAALYPDPERVAVELLPEASARDSLDHVGSKISWESGEWGAVAIAGRGEHRHVALAFHQFRIDRLSWTLLESELEAANRQGLAAADGWARPTIDYLSWVQLYSGTRGQEFAPTYWASLETAACTDLVPDGMRFPTRTDFGVAEVDLGPWSSEDIARAGGLRRISEAVLSAVVLGLASLGDSRVQKIDLLSHGRHVEIPGAGAHDIVGWFTAIYPMVIKAERGDDPTELLKAVEAYQVAVADIAHTFGNQFYGRTKRRVGVRVRCQASYNFLGEIRFHSSGAFTINPLSAETMHGAASHHIEFTGYVRSGRLLVIINYNRAAFSHIKIDNIIYEISKSFKSTILF